MPDMKNIMDLINSQLDIAEEKISELDSIAIKVIQNEIERKKIHKNKRSNSEL